MIARTTTPGRVCEVDGDVYDYFLEQGISASRMDHKGMGGANCWGKMIEKCRRVEIVITRNPYLKSAAPK